MEYAISGSKADLLAVFDKARASLVETEEAVVDFAPNKRGEDNLFLRFEVADDAVELGLLYDKAD